MEEGDPIENYWAIAMWFAVTEGNWSCGYSTKEEWANKSKFGAYKIYYNGYHIAFHLGNFWINCEL